MVANESFRNIFPNDCAPASCLSYRWQHFTFSQQQAPASAIKKIMDSGGRG